MLSRVAYSIYWMARYLERADNVTRFLEVNVTLCLDMGWSKEEAQWEPLIKASGDEQDFEARYQSYDEKSVVEFLTFDLDNPNSIRSCIQMTRENARTVREIIPSEMWEAINALYHLVENNSRRRKVDNLQGFFASVHQANHLFIGLIENIMSQGEGWHFARLGRLLERADKTARMLDVKYFLLLPSKDFVDSPYDTVEWAAVLKSASGHEMYCKQYHRANFHDVAEFLILDPVFPRSIRFCVNHVAQSLHHITTLHDMEVAATDDISKLASTIEKTSMDQVLSQGLHEFVDQFQINLNQIDQAIFNSFFALR